CVRRPASVRVCVRALIADHGCDGSYEIGPRRIWTREIRARRSIDRAEQSAADQCKDHAGENDPQPAAQARRGTQQTELWVHIVRCGRGASSEHRPSQRSWVKPVNCQAVPHSARARSRCRGGCHSQRDERAAPKVTAFKPPRSESAALGQRSCFIAAAIALACPPSGRGSMAEEASWSSEPRAPGNTLGPDC